MTSQRWRPLLAQAIYGSHRTNSLSLKSYSDALSAVSTCRSCAPIRLPMRVGVNVANSEFDDVRQSIEQRDGLEPFPVTHLLLKLS